MNIYFVFGLIIPLAVVLSCECLCAIGKWYVRRPKQAGEATRRFPT